MFEVRGEVSFSVVLLQSIMYVAMCAKHPTP